MPGVGIEIRGFRWPWINYFSGDWPTGASARLSGELKIDFDGAGWVWCEVEDWRMQVFACISTRQFFSFTSNPEERFHDDDVFCAHARQG